MRVRRQVAVVVVAAYSPCVCWMDWVDGRDTDRRSSGTRGRTRLAQHHHHCHDGRGRTPRQPPAAPRASRRHLAGAAGCSARDAAPSARGDQPPALAAAAATARTGARNCSGSSHRRRSWRSWLLRKGHSSANKTPRLSSQFALAWHCARRGARLGFIGANVYDDLDYSSRSRCAASSRRRSGSPPRAGASGGSPYRTASPRPA